MNSSQIIPENALAVVIGAGASGAAAARLLHSLGARVRLTDLKGIPADLQAWAQSAGLETVIGPHQPEHFFGVALVVISPGIPPAKIAPILAAAGNPPLIGEMELALRCTETPILAVTGTSGKTTTVSLAAAMLERAGKTVFLGGNIGTPLSDFILSGQKADVLVLELSSFQLQGCPSLHPRVGMILNLTPNHLDYHKDMAEYTEAKFALFANTGPEDLALLPAGLEPEYRRRKLRARLEILGDGKDFSGLRLAGRHNAVNAEAAFRACRPFGVSFEQALAVARDFQPLPHRLERVVEVRGVTFVNDSKSTTVDSLRTALQSFEYPVLLLAGGKFKGGDLASLRPLLREKVASVGLYGGSKDIFSQAWRGAAPVDQYETLKDAARALFAKALAEKLSGAVILLSPATSSYDQYSDYLARGEDFRRIAALCGKEAAQ